MADLLDQLLSREQKESIRRALVRAGFPDGSFVGILKGVLGAAAAKLAGEAGKEIAKQLGDALEPAVKDLISSSTELGSTKEPDPMMSRFSEKTKMGVGWPSTKTP
jgi:hypothetical protein